MNPLLGVPGEASNVPFGAASSSNQETGGEGSTGSTLLSPGGAEGSFSTGRRNLNVLTGTTTPVAAPGISQAIPDQTGEIGSLFTLNLSSYFNKGSSSSLFFSAANLPSSLQLNTTSGIINGTFPNSVSFQVTVSANSNLGTTSQTFTINPQLAPITPSPPPNTSPSSPPISTQPNTSPSSTSPSYPPPSLSGPSTFSLVDFDGQSIDLSNLFSSESTSVILSLPSLPNGLSFDPGTDSLTIADAGAVPLSTPINIPVTAEDSLGQTGQGRVTVTIYPSLSSLGSLNAQTLPAISVIPDQNGLIAGSTSLNFSGWQSLGFKPSDLSFSEDPGIPYSMTIDPSQGWGNVKLSFSGVPTPSSALPYLSFSVDVNDTRTDETIAVPFILPLNIIQDPITPPNNTSLSLTIGGASTDPLAGTFQPPNLALTYSIVSGPSQLAINPATGVISDTDPSLKPGAYTVTVQGLDQNSGGSAVATVQLTVKPALTATSSTLQGQTFSVNLAGNVINGQTSFNLSGALSLGSGINKNNLTWSIDPTSPLVSFVSIDPASTFNQLIVDLNKLPNSGATQFSVPLLINYPGSNQTIAVTGQFSIGQIKINSSLNGSIQVSMPDETGISLTLPTLTGVTGNFNQPLTCNVLDASGNVSKAVSINNQGALSITNPSALSSGENSFILQIKDGWGSTPVSIPLDLNLTSTAISLTNTAGSTVDLSKQLSADGDTFTFSAPSPLPGGLTLNSSGILSITPQNFGAINSPSSIPITISAIDAAGDASLLQENITVNPAFNLIKPSLNVAPNSDNQSVSFDVSQLFSPGTNFSSFTYSMDSQYQAFFSVDPLQGGSPILTLNYPTGASVGTIIPLRITDPNSKQTTVVLVRLS